MLVMTDNATAIIREITAGLDQTSGLRISRNTADGNLDVAVITAPLADDEIVESDGAAVFLSPDVTGPLAGKALDASIDAADGTVTFTLTNPMP